MNLFLSNKIAPDVMPYSGAILLVSVPRIGHLAPVIQSFISLTLSLSPQFVNYISTSKANPLLFFVEKKVRILCNYFAQRILTFFNKK